MGLDWLQGKRGVRLETLENDLDPPVNVVILLRMLLNNLVGFHDVFSFEFDQFIDDSFDDPNSHFVVLGFVVVVNNHQVLMNGQEDLLHFQLVNQLL